MVVVLIIFLKVFVIDVCALSAAPILGEALVEVFSVLLVASGTHTAEEVNDMSWNEVETALNDGISSGMIDPVQVVGDVTIDGVTKKMNFMEWLAENAKRTHAVITSDTFGTITSTAVKTAISNSLPGTVGSWINTLTKEDVVPTSSIDNKGYGAVLYYPGDGRSNKPFYFYCDYIVVSEMGSPPALYAEAFGEAYVEYYNFDGSFYRSEEATWCPPYEASQCKVYGDVRSNDGSQAESDDTYTDEVGETDDGQKVTLENIQSGEVSAEDTTLDYDKFNDEAIIDLLGQILDAMENVPVVEDTADNTIAEDFAQELEGSVAIELEDISALQLPTGIATVFPFCLPFDFAYGLEILATNPVAPKFEIPFEIPAFGLYPGTKDVITLDFAKYSKYFNVGRWVQVVIFSIGLCFISFKVVKGVH